MRFKGAGDPRCRTWRQRFGKDGSPFGLVSFPIRLQKAARRERIALKYVREIRSEAAEEADSFETEEAPGHEKTPQVAGTPRDCSP